MKDLKKQLIRLGYEKPELREHLKPVLDNIRKESSNHLQAHLDKYTRDRVKVIVDSLPSRNQPVTMGDNSFWALSEQGFEMQFALQVACKSNKIQWHLQIWREGASMGSEWFDAYTPLHPITRYVEEVLERQ